MISYYIPNDDMSIIDFIERRWQSAKYKRIAKELKQAKTEEELRGMFEKHPKYVGQSKDWTYGKESTTIVYPGNVKVNIYWNGDVETPPGFDGVISFPLIDGKGKTKGYDIVKYANGRPAIVSLGKDRIGLRSFANIDKLVQEARGVDLPSRGAIPSEQTPVRREASQPVIMPRTLSDLLKKHGNSQRSAELMEKLKDRNKASELTREEQSTIQAAVDKAINASGSIENFRRQGAPAKIGSTVDGGKVFEYGQGENAAKITYSRDKPPKVTTNDKVNGLVFFPRVNDQGQQTGKFDVVRYNKGKPMAVIEAQGENVGRSSVNLEPIRQKAKESAQQRATPKKSMAQRMAIAMTRDAQKQVRPAGPKRPDATARAPGAARGTPGQTR